MYRRIKTITPPTRIDRERLTESIFDHVGINKGDTKYCLETGKIVSRPYVTAIPITSTIIHAVEIMAKAQGVKTMKITRQNNVQILPANWIAGVHYDEEIEDGDNNSYKGNKNEDNKNDENNNEDNNN